MSIKIAVNRCYGGFSLSEKAEKELERRKGVDTINWWGNKALKRDDPDLIAVIEEMGEDANGSCAEIEIVKIPNGVKWVISEYDGMERVEEAHRSW